MFEIFQKEQDEKCFPWDWQSSIHALPGNLSKMYKSFLLPVALQVPLKSGYWVIPNQVIAHLKNKKFLMSQEMVDNRWGYIVHYFNLYWLILLKSLILACECENKISHCIVLWGLWLVCSLWGTIYNQNTLPSHPLPTSQVRRPHITFMDVSCM